MPTPSAVGVERRNAAAELNEPQRSRTALARSAGRNNAQSRANEQPVVDQNQKETKQPGADPQQAIHIKSDSETEVVIVSNKRLREMTKEPRKPKTARLASTKQEQDEQEVDEQEEDEQEFAGFSDSEFTAVIAQNFGSIRRRDPTNVADGRINKVPEQFSMVLRVPQANGGHLLLEADILPVSVQHQLVIRLRTSGSRTFTELMYIARCRVTQRTA